jgi:hypothetical protein
MLTAIKLCAKNDNNGNPRRIFVVLDATGSIVDTIMEGYEGLAALTNKYPEFKYAD